MSLETLANPQKIFGLVETFGESFETDIPNGKFLDLYNKLRNVASIETVVLGQLANGQSLFVNPPVGQYGAWVLIPPDNDFSQVISLVKQTLEGSQSAVSVSPSPVSKN